MPVSVSFAAEDAVGPSAFLPMPRHQDVAVCRDHVFVGMASLNARQLEERCRELEIPYSGTKTQKIVRIRKWLNISCKCA